MATEPPGPRYAHADFIAAWRSGAVQVDVTPAAAAFISSRLLLPFLLLPVFGAGIALALAGHPVAGLLVFVAGIIFRFAVRRSAPGFVLQRALHSADFYAEALEHGLLVIRPAAQSRDSSPSGF